MLTEEHKLKRSTLLTTIPVLGKEFCISFELFIAKHAPEYQWQNILHLTTGIDSGHLGSRTPGIWMYGRQRMHIVSAINGKANYGLNHYDGVEERRWIHMEIKQISKEGQVEIKLI